MNIVIVDDDQFVLFSLKTILEAGGNIHVQALGKDGKEAVKLYREYRPDVLLIDIQMTGMTGLDAASEILHEYPDAKILLLTTFSDDEYIIKAIQSGVKGYILKQDFEGIAPALSAVQNGQTVFGSEIVGKIPSLFVAGERSNDENQDNRGVRQHKILNYKDFNLSDKEFGIIELVGEGLNNKEIAEKLFLGEGTVRNYISVILEKLELRDRTQLACFYFKNF